MTLARLLPILVLALFGCFGCGGDDASPLEQYFADLQEIDDEQRERAEALDAELQQLTPDDIEEIKRLYREQLVVLEDFTEAMDRLEPPVEVEEVHGSSIENLRAFNEAFAATLEEMEGAETFADIQRVLRDADFSALDSANADCRELELIAANFDIEVDFDCE